MGLDGVEIVMELEDEFGVSIPDRALESVRTVEDFASVFWAHLAEQHSNDAPCPRARCFLELRRKILEDSDIQRADLRPSTTIESLNQQLPSGFLMSRWAQWRMKLPWLPQPVMQWNDQTFRRVSQFQLLLLFLAIGVPAALHAHLDTWLLVLIDLPLVFLMLYSVKWCLGPLALEEQFRTLGDVVRHAVPPRLLLTHGLANPEWFKSVNYVMMRVRSVIAELEGLELSEVLPETELNSIVG